MVPAPGSDRGVARDLGARHTDTLGQQLAQPREQSAGAPPSPALGRAAKGKPRAIVLGMTPGTPCTSPERARATVPRDDHEGVWCGAVAWVGQDLREILERVTLSASNLLSLATRE